MLTKEEHKKGLLALSPILVFELFFVGFMLMAGDMNNVPLLLCFLLASIYAVALYKSGKLEDRINVYSSEAGRNDIIQMVWVFVLAGGFAQIAEASGALHALVQFCLSICPPAYIFIGLFLGTCLVSFCIGSGMSCVIAIAPVAAQISELCGVNMPFMMGLVVGGALFGDNLSLISDTTIAATRGTGSSPREKFLINWPITLGAALITAGIYWYLGRDLAGTTFSPEPCNWLMLIPYAFIFVTALCGMHVFIVLLLAIAITWVLGLMTGSLVWLDGATAVTAGMYSMGGFTLIFLLAAGLVAIIQRMGGLSYVVALINDLVHTRVQAGLALAFSSAVLTACTSINTIAIVTFAPVASKIADRFGISRVKTAVLLDSCSCAIQCAIPYGPTLLAAAGAAHISPMSIVKWTFFPYMLFILCLIYCTLPERKTRLQAQMQTTEQPIENA